MNAASLIGFGAKLPDIKERLRFCTPLLMFEDDENSLIYYAQSLSWSATEDGFHRLSRVAEDEVEEFGTLLPEAVEGISPGTGVVVMGPGFSEIADRFQLADSSEIEFSEFTELDCRMGLSTVEVFRRLEESLVSIAKEKFDDELGASFGVSLSEKGRFALKVLEKCGSVRNTDVAIRELAAAWITNRNDRYRRLLIQSSIELHESENIINDRVKRFVDNLVYKQLFSQRASQIGQTPMFQMPATAEQSLEQPAHACVTNPTHMTLDTSTSNFIEISVGENMISAVTEEANYHEWYFEKAQPDLQRNISIWLDERLETERLDLGNYYIEKTAA